MKSRPTLSEFVKTVVSEIVAGVAKTQKLIEESGATLSPKFRWVPSSALAQQGIAISYRGRKISIVSFDVAVTTESTRGGKANVKVLGLVEGGIEGGRSIDKSEVSRITFSLPLGLPGHNDENEEYEVDKQSEEEEDLEDEGEYSDDEDE